MYQLSASSFGAAMHHGGGFIDKREIMLMLPRNINAVRLEKLFKAIGKNKIDAVIIPDILFLKEHRVLDTVEFDIILRSTGDSLPLLNNLPAEISGIWQEESGVENENKPLNQANDRWQHILNRGLKYFVSFGRLNTDESKASLEKLKAWSHGIILRGSRPYSLPAFKKLAEVPESVGDHPLYIVAKLGEKITKFLPCVGGVIIRLADPRCEAAKLNDYIKALKTVA